MLIELGQFSAHDFDCASGIFAVRPSLICSRQDDRNKMHLEHYVQSNSKRSYNSKRHTIVSQQVTSEICGYLSRRDNGHEKAVRMTASNSDDDSKRPLTAPTRTTTKPVAAVDSLSTTSNVGCLL
jgi:hypothetical protein